MASHLQMGEKTQITLRENYGIRVQRNGDCLDDVLMKEAKILRLVHSKKIYRNDELRNRDLEN
jgi:hypothetical protein